MMRVLALILLANIFGQAAMAQPVPASACAGNYATTTSQLVDANRNRGGVVFNFIDPQTVIVYLRRGDEGFNNPRPLDLNGYMNMGQAPITVKRDGQSVSYLFSYNGALGVVDVVMTQNGPNLTFRMTPRGMGTANGSATCRSPNQIAILVSRPQT